MWYNIHTEIAGGRRGRGRSFLRPRPPPCQGFYGQTSNFPAHRSVQGWRSQQVRQPPPPPVRPSPIFLKTVQTIRTVSTAGAYRRAAACSWSGRQGATRRRELRPGCLHHRRNGVKHGCAIRGHGVSAGGGIEGALSKGQSSEKRNAYVDSLRGWIRTFRRCDGHSGQVRHPEDRLHRGHRHPHPCGAGFCVDHGVCRGLPGGDPEHRPHNAPLSGAVRPGYRSLLAVLLQGPPAG